MRCWRGYLQGQIWSKQGPVQNKCGSPSLIYEYHQTEFTRHAQWQCCHHRYFVIRTRIMHTEKKAVCQLPAGNIWLDTSWRQRATQNRFLIIISIISGISLCCKNLPVLLRGPLFVGPPDRPNMLNMPKSASGYLSGVTCKWFAYGPVDATATPLSLSSLKFRLA